MGDVEIFENKTVTRKVQLSVSLIFLPYFDICDPTVQTHSRMDSICFISEQNKNLFMVKSSVCPPIDH